MGSSGSRGSTPSTATSDAASVTVTEEKLVVWEGEWVTMKSVARQLRENYMELSAFVGAKRSEYGLDVAADSADQYASESLARARELHARYPWALPCIGISSCGVIVLTRSMHRGMHIAFRRGILASAGVAVALYPREIKNTAVKLLKA